MTKPPLQDIANGLVDLFAFMPENSKQRCVDKLTRSVAIEDDDISPNEIPAVIALMMLRLAESQAEDLARRLCDFARACG